MMFVDPTLGNLFERSRIEIVQLLPAAPKRNDQLRPNQNSEMLANSLAGHVQMPAKFVKGLSVVLMELVQQGAAGRVGKCFKNGIHPGRLCNQMVAYQGPLQAAFGHFSEPRAAHA